MTHDLGRRVLPVIISECLDVLRFCLYDICGIGSSSTRPHSHFPFTTKYQGPHRPGLFLSLTFTFHDTHVFSFPVRIASFVRGKAR
jgi:hypothetical protein